MHTILITGATGNLGSRTLAECLKVTDARLVLLVYGASKDDAIKAVDSVVEFWSIPRSSMNRVEILHGDITHPTLKLQPDEYERLSNTVTHVIHCAANFKLDLSLDEARKSIVEATRYVVQLCRASHEKGIFRKFNYISSLDAAGTLEGPIPEDFLSQVPRRFLNTYQQAKAEAEDLLETEYRTHGFPVTLFRPSMLVGDSQTGKIINPQSLYHIIHDMFLEPPSKILPGKTFRVDPVPIDVVAAGLVALYDEEETSGRVYNFVSGYEASLTLPEFITMVAEVYERLTGVRTTPPRFIHPYIPYLILSVAAFCTRGRTRALVSTQRNMVRYLFLDARPLNTELTVQLAKKGVHVPPLSSYLYTLCKYMFETQKALQHLHIHT